MHIKVSGSLSSKRRKEQMNIAGEQTRTNDFQLRLITRARLANLCSTNGIDLRPAAHAFADWQENEENRKSVKM